MKIEHMPHDQCVALLEREHLGSLACSLDGQPYVVPITFSYNHGSIYAFSMPGQKIDWMRKNPKVSFVVEEHGPDRTWKSVVVMGRYEELPDLIGRKVARERAWQLLSQRANWWEPGSLKPGPQALAGHSPHLFFRILCDTITGRRCID